MVRIEPTKKVKLLEQQQPVTAKKSNEKKNRFLVFADWLSNPQYNSTGPISFKPASGGTSTASATN